MTLVLTCATAGMVLQVGDRLLSRKGVAWDPKANKSVVVVGTDGWASVSYSGLGYLDAQPTDQWLAEVISDRRFPERKPKDPAWASPMLVVDAHLPRVGPALHRLPTSIEVVLNRQPAAYRKLGLHVAVGGVIFGRRRSRPFIRRFSHHGLRDGHVTTSEDRHWDWSRTWAIGFLPNPPDEDLLRVLYQGLESAAGGDDCERLMADCIRAVSERNPTTVGRDCMSIMLVPPNRYIRLRFLPDPSNDTGQNTYTPWLVAPGLMAAPMLLSESLPHFENPHIDVDRVPPLAPGVGFYAEPHPRPPFP